MEVILKYCNICPKIYFIIICTLQQNLGVPQNHKKITTYTKAFIYQILSCIAILVSGSQWFDPGAGLP